VDSINAIRANIVDRDDKKQPREGEFRLVPAWNSLGFFVVNPCSYHQVCEVLGTKPRISITGWLYGSPTDLSSVPPNPKYSKDVLAESFAPLFSFSETNTCEESVLETWISADYTKEAMIEKMKDVFLDESCIELRQFLKPGVFEQLQKELSLAAMSPDTTTSSSITVWKPATGLGVQCQLYHLLHHRISLEQASTPSAISLKSFAAFLKSSTFKNYVYKLTGLGLHPDRIESEFKRFPNGGYQLIHDHPHIGSSHLAWLQDKDTSKLDLDLFFSPDFPSDDDSTCLTSGKYTLPASGGYTWYVDSDSGDTLLKIRPLQNMLSIVYRDVGTQRCVRYVGACTGCEERTELSLVYGVQEDE
jgi:hypothetical protein